MEPAPGAVPHTGHMGNNLIVSRIHEPRKLDFGNWSESVDGHSHRHTNNSTLSQGCVKAAVDTVLLLESHGGSKDTAFNTDVFAKYHYPVVPGHFVIKRMINSTDQIQKGHAISPSLQGTVHTRCTVPQDVQAC